MSEVASREEGDRKSDVGSRLRGRDQRSEVRKKDAGCRLLAKLTSDVRCPTSDVRCPMSDVRRPMSDVRCPMSDVRRPMSDVRRPAWKLSWREDGKMSQNRRQGRINSAKDLEVYQLAYELAMQIFEISKTWPKEERYSLTDQIRRSSRSVCGNLREAWSKRRYEAHFVSKLTDADGENSETDSWLDFAKDCGYISSDQHYALVKKCQSVGSMLGSMMKNPEPFILK